MAMLPRIVDAQKIEESIGFLKAYLNEDDIAPLISALQELAQNTEDKSRLAKLSDVFNKVTVSQGAILTYAPYVGMLLEDDSIESEYDLEPADDRPAVMANKLVQKHPLKGTQTFEIVDDAIEMRIKKPFQDETMQHVMLTILNPVPEVEKNMLHFHSRVKCGPLLSLYLNKPNKEEFDAFVETVKYLALKEYKTFAGIK